MATVQDINAEIGRIAAAKTNIIGAIEQKGVSVPADAMIQDLPQKILDIPQPEPILEGVDITPSTSQQVIVPQSPVKGFDRVTVGPVTHDIDANIVPGNIKKDVTILGVNGTYDGGVYPIPDEYQAVEYLQCNGQQYVFLPLGGNSMRDLCLIIEGKLADSPDNRAIFGTVQVTGQHPVQLYQVTTYRHKFYYGFVTAEKNGGSFTDGQDIFLKFNEASTHNIIVNNEIIGQAAETYPINPIALFRRWGNSNYFNGRIKNALAIDNTMGKNLVNLKPCYRKIDNKPGLWDLINGLFLTNDNPDENAADFTVGPNI